LGETLAAVASKKKLNLNDLVAEIVKRLPSNA